MTIDNQTNNGSNIGGTFQQSLDDLTNGSAKIFGMENFGNTCYCNSVLQCLYYSEAFREHILAFPYPKLESPTAIPKVRQNRPRRTSVVGKTPHPFKVNPATAQLNTSVGAPDTSNVPPQNGVNGNGQKKGLFGWGNKKDSASGDEGEEGVDEGLIAASETRNTVHKKDLAPGLTGITIGSYFPGQNAPIVGFTDDPFATQEQRKRAALVKGPIINQDETECPQYDMPESLFTALKDVYESMAENASRTGVVSPSRLIEVVKQENELFRTSMHQDAHEFFNFLLNEVIENVDKYNAKHDFRGSEHRWVHNLFEGLLTSETKCLTCENISRRDEQFLDLSIDLERNSSITSCLQQFSASEMLCEGNKFHCDTCGGLEEAEKRMKVKQLPKILALHLKRFKFTEDMQRNVKLFHRVLYPRHIRLMNTTYDAEDPDRLYELYAVVVHIGGGPYHGHYVAVVKTEQCGWLLFDDEMVEAVDSSYVFNFFGDNKGMATAYVLFYQQTTQEALEKENLHTSEDIGAPLSPMASNGSDSSNSSNVANETAINGSNGRMAPQTIHEESEDVFVQAPEPISPVAIPNGSDRGIGSDRINDISDGNSIGTSFGSKLVGRTKSKKDDISKRSRVFSFSRKK